MALIMVDCCSIKYPESFAEYEDERGMGGYGFVRLVLGGLYLRWMGQAR